MKNEDGNLSQDISEAKPPHVENASCEWEGSVVRRAGLSHESCEMRMKTASHENGRQIRRRGKSGTSSV